MAYEQYSIYAYTGNVEDAKNRVANNAADSTHTEDIGFPDRFDIFVNKENASVGGFAVTEDHATNDLVGSKLYLDHKIYVDSTGGYDLPTVSDGILDATTVDVFASSVEFSTLPSVVNFNVSYNAGSDKIIDSHINVVQNAVMRMQQILGLRNAINGVGTGLTTLPLVTQYSPPDQTAIDSIRATIAPNIILIGDLEGDIKIGSTENSLLDSFGGDGYLVKIGNPGLGATDEVQINAGDLRVNDGREGFLYYSMNTGDWIGFSGRSEFASQVTVGTSWGSDGDYQGLIPGNLSGFYSEAMLRVNGGIYFGAGMSGNGEITFVVSSGEKVDIVGTLEATDLHVENTSLFDGISTFNAKADAIYPGYFTTNSEIELRDRGGFPTKIDALDPSYARVVVESDAHIDGTVSTYMRDPTFANDYHPYVSGSKAHPVHGFEMYPLVGGWMFTGQVKFAKATFHSHKQVLLLDTSMDSVTGFGNTIGSYSPGMFSPGDTFVEVNDGGTAKVAYPIYYHEAEEAGGDTITGLNVWIPSDDDIHTSPSIVGQDYRLFQPSNAPLFHLQSDFSTPTAPTVSFGHPNGGYYASSNAKAVEFKTDPAFVGPSVGNDPQPLYKRLTDNSTVSAFLLTALQRNIDYEQIVNQGGWGVGDHNPPGGIEFGTAYVFATSDSSRAGTQFEQVKLKASPSPFGIAAKNIWTAGIKLNPGQWTIVGEVVGTTSDGTSWTHVDTVCYRPNAFYDSCWIPMVNYRDSSMAAAALQTVPDDIGRCLPIHGSTDGAGVNDQFATSEGDHNFYVEHNIGPVHSLKEISVRIFIASFQAGGYASPSNDAWPSIHRMSAAGSANLWTPFSMPYSSVHDKYHAAGAAGAGFLKEITSECQVRAFDSRFCRISFTDNTPLQDINGNAQYIRIVIRRTV
jgi:hypothetical protein